MTDTNNPQWLDDAIVDINNKGPVRRTDESGNPSVEYMEVVKEGNSVSARVKALMDKGMSEDDAKKNAVQEVTDRMDGKLEFPDMESYIRFVADFDRTDKEKQGFFTFTEQEFRDVVAKNPDPDLNNGPLNRLLNDLTTPGRIVKCHYYYDDYNNRILMAGYLYKSKDGSYKFFPNPKTDSLDSSIQEEHRISLKKWFRGNISLDAHAEFQLPRGFTLISSEDPTNLIRSIAYSRERAQIERKRKSEEKSFDF